MKQNTRKESELKVRIPIKEKKQLQSIAQKHGMTLSAYIRMKCLEHTNEWIHLIPTTVELWNTFNEIFQVIEQTRDQALIQTIQEILNKSFAEQEDINEQ